ncbi:3D domain-containing protein [Rossellomorea marisflavi]|uniref:3D domain-containing protein n=1 Tax=Rossellomorea marisflavi TaxID=189381 RepID=UPI0015C4860B|nr:3D domain-containing protein [Rossellomorea marisflavi]
MDPNVIPLGSTVEFTLADGRRITAVAADTGGAIRGNRMDLLVWTRDRALDIGRQNVDVTIHEGR